MPLSPKTPFNELKIIKAFFACSFVSEMDYLSGRFGVVTEIRGVNRDRIRLDESVGQGGWVLTRHMVEKVCDDVDVSANPEVSYEKLISLLGGVEFET